MTVVDSYWDEKEEKEVFLREMISIPPYPEDDIISAMKTVRNSEWFLERLEDANYHNLHWFIEDLIVDAEREQLLDRREVS